MILIVINKVVVDMIMEVVVIRGRGRGVVKGLQDNVAGDELSHFSFVFFFLSSSGYWDITHIPLCVLDHNGSIRFKDLLLTSLNPLLAYFIQSKCTNANSNPHKPFPFTHRMNSSSPQFQVSTFDISLEVVTLIEGRVRQDVKWPHTR